MSRPPHAAARARWPRFVPLATARLSLTALALEHAPAVFAYASDPAIARLVGAEPHSDLSMTRRMLARAMVGYAKGGHYEWAILRRSDGVLLGTCGLSELDAARARAELGYVLSPQYFGHGFATEASRAVLRFAFEELKLRRVEALVFADHAASQRVLAKLGLHIVSVELSPDDAEPVPVQRWRLDRARFVCE